MPSVSSRVTKKGFVKRPRCSLNTQVRIEDDQKAKQFDHKREAIRAQEMQAEAMATMGRRKPAVVSLCFRSEENARQRW